MANPDLRRERIGWLHSLVTTFEAEHDWDVDEDPSATSEAIRECRALADELEAELPAPDPPAAGWAADDPTIPF